VTLNISRFLAAVLTAMSLLVPSVYAQETPGAATSADPGASVVQSSDETQAAPDLVAVQTIQATVTSYANGGDGAAIGSMTASGVRTHWGTVAADLRLYPMGTRLQIEGFADQVFTVEDTGGGVRGNLFDVWFPDLATAVAFGTKSLKVTILAKQ
jgi:3D (Asp-Asp-Asp) domain-containing protein